MPSAKYFPQEIIRRKRDGAELAAEEIEFMVRGITDGAASEGQIAAFAMAIFFRGMSMDERVVLARAMTNSGRLLDWRPAAMPGPILDKHSTGGVGDKVSLMLAPIVAACGGFVPMISGRGLGHTGGTLDKMDSIPGYRTMPDLDRFQQVVRTAGCAIIGQTADLAPADGRFYAIRDVTATVESIALLTTSILSKKLAAGLDGLTMDVKFGSGAFIPPIEGAVELAESIVTVANGAGLATTALLTDMNEVLGTSAGNAIEVREAIAYLRGEARETRLDTVTRALATEMLLLGDLARDATEARAMVEGALASGKAADSFARMVAALDGPADIVERATEHLPLASVVLPAAPERAGVITAIDVRKVGIVVMMLGGGRRRADDRIDHSVGLDAIAGLGEHVGPDRPLARIHARTVEDAQSAVAALRAAFEIGERAPLPGPVILRRIGGLP
ncbi:MAG TPA: thymidine phosphorylase [Alphaproteobacteria bacterium]|nr:thymidine phosphorylase [Alphaproteobacteria bacterium]